MEHFERKQTRNVLRALFLVSGLFATTMLSGCIVGGYSSSGGGHFFLFPSLGVILVIVVLFALLRRR